MFGELLCDLSMPIITVLSTGDSVKDDPFNYFFSLMVGLGLVILVPVAICAVFRESMKG